MSRKKSYSQLLQDPKWIKVSADLRREIPYCQLCTRPDKEVVTQVHHGFYNQTLKPWDYPKESLWVLCKDCHEVMDKARRQVAVLFGHAHPTKVAHIVQVLAKIIAMPNDQPFEVMFRALPRPGQLAIPR
jgi:hypothetical protein